MLRRDLQYAFRVLCKSPGFTLAVIAVLALGIGANTAIFSLVNAVLLRPLPFHEPDRLVRLFHIPPQDKFPGVPLFSVSTANYLDWKSSTHSFEGMAAYGIRTAGLTGERPESLLMGSVTSDFFSVIGTPPAAGRVFLPEEDQPGRNLVVVISDSFWKSHLGSDPHAVGKPLTLSRQQYTIVGIMPPSFELKSWGATNVQMWSPMGWDDKERAIRGNHNYQVIARLRPGVDLKAAKAELDSVSQHLAAQYPQDNAGWGATPVKLYELIVGDVRPVLLVLLGSVAFVLLIASANVANLVLSRTLGRRKEMAVRAALGASRALVLQHVLCETLLLSLAGGAAGLLLARGAISLMAATLADQLPRASEIALDSRVLTFTAAVSLLSGILAGLAPAWRAGRVDLNDALKQGLGRTDSPSTGRGVRNALVVAEVMLSFVLLTGAGLMIRTMWNIRHVDPGMDPHNVLTMIVALPKAQYSTATQKTTFFDEVLRRTRALPGVQLAALIDNLPMTGGSMQPVTFEGRPAGSMAEQPEVAVRQSSPGYLATMRIPLKSGRDFRESDVNAVLVSESMAKQFWPGQDPVGRHMGFTFIPGQTWEVIGVVGDVKMGALTEQAPRATAYQWSKLRDWAFMRLVLRTNAAAGGYAPQVRELIREIDPDQPVRNVTTMDEVIESSVASERLSAQVLGAFAGIAVLLAGVGIYSVLAYAVRGRSREIGIRTALGAGTSDVVRLVLLEISKPALAGVVLGAAAALAMSKVMTKMVYGVSPTDPSMFAAVAALFAVVAVVASALPAYRAARVDPLTTLREE